MRGLGYWGFNVPPSFPCLVSFIDRLTPPQTKTEVERTKLLYTVSSQGTALLTPTPSFLPELKIGCLPLLLFPTLKRHPRETARWLLSPSVLQPNAWVAILYSVHFGDIGCLKLSTSRKWHLQLEFSSEAKAGKAPRQQCQFSCPSR